MKKRKRYHSTELPTGLGKAHSGSWQAVRSSKRSEGPFRMAGPGKARTLAERELARRARVERSLDSGEGVADGSPETDLERAQDLVYQAWEQPAESRSEAALRALVLSPRCADAYLLLADGAPTARERLQLCRQAIIAGKAALRDSIDTGADMWAVLTARPYLRARAAYARALWDMGELRPAADELRQLQRMNPGDNLGLRYLMLPLLIQLGELGEAEELTRVWDREPSPEWEFNRSLLAFAQRGAGKARPLLQRALDLNPHVPDYLLGLLPVPRKLPDAITFGGPDQALDYAARAHGAWARVPGALDWLAAEALQQAS